MVGGSPEQYQNVFMLYSKGPNIPSIVEYKSKLGFRVLVKLLRCLKLMHT